MQRSPLPPDLDAFVAGAGAGASATVLTYPLDLLRTRFAARQSRQVITSLPKDIRAIYLVDGISGFFRGLRVSLWQIVPHMGLFFSTYEALQPFFKDGSLPFGVNDAAKGAVAGVVAKTGVFPLDLMKKRLQIAGESTSRNGSLHATSANALKLAKDILAREGPRGLYHGLTVSLLKSAPTSAITMWTFERTMTLLNRADFDYV